MSADVLRQAAALMRERAEAAVQPTSALGWIVDRADRFALPHEVYNGPLGRNSHDVASATDDETATHIASWHPAVALAVADWLEIEAGKWQAETAGGLGQQFAETYFHGALVAARAYLGADA